MFSLHEELKHVPWAHLSHAYGPATDTPSHLLSLLSPEAEKREAALDQLWASICHQGSVYEASGEAAMCLIHILQMIPDEQKPAILQLLDGLAHGYQYANRDQVRLHMDHSGGHSQQRWQSMRQFLQEGNIYHQPHWMERTHRLVGEGLPTYLTLLQSTDQKTVCETLNLLACFQELNHVIVPVVIPLLSETADPFVAASALACLSTILDPSSTHWERFYQIVNADPSQISPLVRLRAAHALARHHSENIPPTALDIMVEHMLQPVMLNTSEDESVRESEEESGNVFYDIDCESLSCLGIPRGLQGLTSALEQGASRWSVLDTMRVAEALLDVAFFGCWVEGRYWTYRSKHSLDFSLEVDTIRNRRRYTPGDSIVSSYNLPDLDNDHAAFQFDYDGMGIQIGTDGVVDYVSEYFIEVSGYDKGEASRLQRLYEREGSQALLVYQREALEAVLLCEVLWTFRHNLLEIYGLPIVREEVRLLLRGE
ncbi:MAG: hypothetical protein ABI324_07125 [Ktedonobacteraceae bacterium]